MSEKPLLLAIKELTNVYEHGKEEDLTCSLLLFQEKEDTSKTYSRNIWYEHSVHLVILLFFLLLLTFEVKVLNDKKFYQNSLICRYSLLCRLNKNVPRLLVNIEVG